MADEGQDTDDGVDASFWRIIRERRYRNLALVGLVGLLASFLGETVLELLRENLRHHIPEPYVFGLKIAVYFAHMFVFLARDIGIACWIALVLGALIERVARIEQRLLVERAIVAIKSDVLRAAYGVKVPASIVGLAIEKVFAASVIRESYRLTYTLVPSEVLGPDHVLLKLETESEFRNVSGRTIQHDVRLRIPLRTDPKLRDFSKLNGGAIGSEPLTPALIKEGDDAVADSDYEKQFLWVREIKPGGSLLAVFRIQLVKDKADNEIWTSLYPSEPPQVTVDVQCPDLEWDVHPLFCGDLPTVEGTPEGARSSGEIVRFSASAPLLPYHGLVLWWRPKPPVKVDGTVVTNAPQNANK